MLQAIRTFALATICFVLSLGVHALPTCKPGPGRVLVVSNIGGEAANVAANFQSRMPGWTFGWYDARSSTPSLSLLNQFDVVLLYENGLFSNAPNVGNAVNAFYSQGNRGVVLGIFFWQDLSDSPQYPSNYGWGTLESVVPLVNSSGYEYNARTLNPATLVPHPITAGVYGLYTPNYAGGLRAAPGATVLGYWFERNFDGSLDPAIGIKEQFGSRIAGISLFPAMPGSGAWYELWRNTFTWAAFRSECTPDTPTATHDAYSTDEDVALSVAAPGVLGNDSGGTLSASLVAAPSNGTVTISANGAFVYTPKSNFVGTDTFRYRAANTNGAVAEANVAVTVIAVNDTAIAENDAYTTDEDQGVTVTAAQGVLANDMDIDAGDSLRAELVGAPPNASSFTLNPDGSFSYAPAPDFNGSDTFTYRARDSAGVASNTAMVVITVRSVNDPPIARPDGFTIPEDGMLAVPPGALTANDSGGPRETSPGLSVTALTAGPETHGTVELVAGVVSSVTYKPASNYAGPASFSYTLCDDGTPQLCTEGIVNVTVTPVNDAPTTSQGPLSTPEDTAAVFSLNAADVDSTNLTFTIVSQTGHGSVALQPPVMCTPGGGGSQCVVKAQYVPPHNFHGTTSFTYRVFDGSLSSAPVTVAITVNPVNDPPIASNDSAVTLEDTPVSIAVAANDVDVDGDPLSIVGASDGANGTVSCSASGCTYTPAANFHGTDQFTYTVQDAAGARAGATVAITVRAVNDPPGDVQVFGSSTTERGTATINVTFRNVDPGDTHSAVVDWGDGQTSTYALGGADSFSASHAYLDDNAADAYAVTVTITDAAGLGASGSGMVGVTNLGPIMGGVTGPTGPVAAGSAVTVTAAYSDAGVLDTHSCTFAWGDGTHTTVAAVGGACTASHAYAASNVHEVAITVTDDDGGIASDTFRYVVVYDASAGFVTGGGWIDSPAGAYVPDPAAVGKATFGFVSKYKPGQSVPTGNTEFQFKAAGLSFRSSSYEWMVISGQKARYRGIGTVNGVAGFGFELTAWDGDTDKLRLQIWDGNRGNALVYDNELGKEAGADPTTALAGGSIQIHR